jgi:hypothetical protein
VRWNDTFLDEFTTGPYVLARTGSARPILDCALRFTAGMYSRGQTQCLSFSGPFKHLKLGKGGAILTDSAEDAAWFKRARFSGRRECSYHDDNFDMLGWNCYMHPLIAAQGLLLMGQFLRADGSRALNADLSIRFPDLSRFPIYTQLDSGWLDAINHLSADGFNMIAEHAPWIAEMIQRETGKTRAELRKMARAIDVPTLLPSRELAPQHLGAQSFQVTPEEADKIGAGLLRDPNIGRNSVGRAVADSVPIPGSKYHAVEITPDGSVARSPAPIRYVVDPAREPWPGYNEFRGAP